MSFGIGFQVSDEGTPEKEQRKRSITLRLEYLSST